MHILRRAWRRVFAPSELRDDSPLSLDDARQLSTFLIFTVPIVAFALALSVGGAVLPEGPVARVVRLVISAIAFVGPFLWILVRRATVADRFQARRAAAAGHVRAAGWTFLDDAALPTPQTREAVFHRYKRSLVPTGFSEVSIGRYEGKPFSAGHLAGLVLPEDGERGPGLDYSENIVIMSLPGLLPELKLRDRSVAEARDYGISLPIVAMPDAGRWESPHLQRWAVQSNYPDFATDLLADEGIRRYLEAVPRLPCTITFRNGYLIASRDPEGTYESILVRLQILSGLIDRLPARVWERETSPGVAGSTLRLPTLKREKPMR